MQFIVIDFETRSDTDLGKCGVWAYSESPRTEVICVSWNCPGGGIERWEPVLKNEPVPQSLYDLARDEDIIFEAHNAQFEQAIWANVMVKRYGLPPVPIERWHDTMAVCLDKGLPGSLENAGHILGLSEQKDKYGKYLLQTLSKPEKFGSKQKREFEQAFGVSLTCAAYFRHDTELLKDCADYCDQDVRTEGELSERLGGLSAKERKVWELDQRINQRGLRIDLYAVECAYDLVNETVESLKSELHTLTDGRLRTPGQRDKALALIEELEGWQPQSWGAADLEKALPAIQNETARRIVEIRLATAKSSTSKLDTMLNAVCADGRIRGTLQYQGAGSTGRWAGRLVQPQNLPQGNVKADPDELIQDIKRFDAGLLVQKYDTGVLDCVSSALRGMFVPDEGNKFIAGDFSAIEARVVLALAGQDDKVNIMANGQDIYLDMASKIYGYKCTSKDEHPTERHVGKSAVLGLGFQCGPDRFQSQFVPDQSVEFCEEIVRTYRKEFAPMVPKFWYNTEEAAVRAVRYGETVRCGHVSYRVEDEWLLCRLPSGRDLYYHNPRTKMIEDDRAPTGVKLQLQFDAWKYGQWRTVDAYGGLLVENVVQGVARDIMADAMLRAEDAGYPVILTVHDELVTEPPNDFGSAEELEAIMSERPEWVQRCNIPVAAETWEGERYRK